jgi:uncharacterized metal-binding protein YceD (DUF177 family)
MTWTITLLRWTARILWTSVDEAIDWDTVDVAERFDDERLAEAVDWDEVDVYDYVNENEHLTAPVDRLHELDDDADRIYVWLVETEEAEAQLTRQISEEYREAYGREPRAAHFVVDDLDDLREFESDDLAYWVDPAKAGGDA